MSQFEKAYRYRFYPTKEQEQSLTDTFGCCRVDAADGGGDGGGDTGAEVGHESLTIRSYERSRETMFSRPMGLALWMFHAGSDAGKCSGCALCQ